MAPKSHSAKSSPGFNAKLTSSVTKAKEELLKSRKSAVSFCMKKNDKKTKLKGRKGAVSPSAKENDKVSSKENRKDVKRELLKGDKSAVSSNAKKDYHAQLKKLEAENDALRKTLKMNLNEDDTTMIPRPEKGVVYKGFNLQEAMGLADDNEMYGVLRRCVRDLSAQAGLDCSVLWYRQPKDIISKIIGTARQRHSYFKRFPHGWAIEEFLKTSLKNKRAYARKRGYLGDMTNRGSEGSSGGGDGVEGFSDSDQGGDGGGKNDHSDIDTDGDTDDNKSASNNEFEGHSASNEPENENDIDEDDDIYQDKDE